MKLTFYMHYKFGSLFPACSNDDTAYAKCDPLSNILFDDGGLGKEHMIKWIAVGIEYIQKVLNDETESAEWGCENFSAAIGKTKTKVYSNYDNSYCQVMYTENFLKVMIAWYEFILQPFTADLMEIVEIFD